MAGKTPEPDQEPREGLAPEPEEALLEDGDRDEALGDEALGDEAWTDPELRWKLANEAWLQDHWKLVVPVILVVAFCAFILPWVFLPWLPALGIQLFCGGFIYLGAKRYTTAFDR